MYIALKIETLYEVADDVLAVAGEVVDDGNLNHRVATWLLAHGGTSHIDEHLSREGRIVNLHVELEELVVGFATHNPVDVAFRIPSLWYSSHWGRSNGVRTESRGGQ